MCKPNFTCNRPKVEGAIGHKDNFYTFVMKEVQASISACIFHLILFISMALKFKIAKRKLYVGKKNIPVPLGSRWRDVSPAPLGLRAQTFGLP